MQADVQGTTNSGGLTCVTLPSGKLMWMCMHRQWRLSFGAGDSQSLRSRMLARWKMRAMSSGGSSCQAWRPRDRSSSDSEDVREGAFGGRCALACLCCLVSAIFTRGSTLQCDTASRKPSRIPAMRASWHKDPSPQLPVMPASRS